MAGIQDPLTDLPPPSRLDLEELSNFPVDASRASSAPSPSILWNSNVDVKTPLRPRLLFVASSSSGLHLLRHLPSKMLLGSVVLLGDDSLDAASSHGSISYTGDGNIKSPSVYDGRFPQKQFSHHCSIYSLDGQQASIILLPVEKPILEERANAWAKAVLGAIAADTVVVVAMVQREHYRGRLSADDEVIFRLETDAVRIGEKERVSISDKYVPYFPSGSLVSGLPAAILTRCQHLGLRARLLLSWPEACSSAPLNLVKALKCLPEMKDIDFSYSLEVPFKAKSVSDLDMYI
ncbi:hypothetical protein KP509_33G013300 [Ceratopteris richardii]|uniref:Proteasome assembly chaperone 1 n=1 Tax=Ceratopteris richardii TaxID=49495 RepID=A0A8T2QN92_CERRI|nr:hypothetical protein KP509_33G013300 [Ceratopteris richardii]